MWKEIANVKEDPKEDVVDVVEIKGNLNLDIDLDLDTIFF